MTTTEKLYASRDPMQLDEDGNYFFRHMSAMTGERLHSKSAIAAELGHRDRTIDAQAAEIAALRALLEAKTADHARDYTKLKEVEAQKFARFANEDCWLWQGDGTDSLETLTCPVVISPQAMLALQSELSALRASMEGKVLCDAEPVAWLCDANDGQNKDAVVTLHGRDTYARHGRTITPLYASPSDTAADMPRHAPECDCPGCSALRTFRRVYGQPNTPSDTAPAVDSVQVDYKAMAEAVAAPDSIKGRFASELFWQGVYAMRDALTAQGGKHD
jgi:hypothetical protein